MPSILKGDRGHTREGAKKTIPEIMVFGWRGALSAIAYEGHGWKGRTHKKIYETP
jgi:hypothetical protein